MADDPLRLPDDLIEWVAETVGGPVTSATRVPGGASREAWFVDVAVGDDPPRRLFVRYARTPTAPGGVFHSLQVEGEVLLALRDTAVKVPPTLAVHPVHEAILEERVEGDTWFYRITDPDEQVAVARDFVASLAAQHRLDPRTLDLPSLGPVTTARRHALDEVAAMRRRATDEKGRIDPLLDISLRWLEHHVPEYDGPVVLVQGDTGPGNFMYRDGAVTAVVDWELAHFGDPMDDIAWLSLRTVQDTFTHLPDRLREYEQLSGIEIDDDRVWYYRLFAETRLASHRAASGGPATDGPAQRDIGNALIYGVLHRRLTLEALARVMGEELEPVECLPDQDPEEWHHLYDAALGMLSTVVRRVDDPLASQWTKGVARVVKYLKELDRNGRAYRDEEWRDQATLLGELPSSAPAGRVAVAQAWRAGKVSDEAYLRYMWRQVKRDDNLMATASGQLRHRTWPPLRDPTDAGPG